VLGVLWLVLNLADIAISWCAVQVGAIEIGWLYRIAGGWPGLAVIKMLLAVVIGGLLVSEKKTGWLAVLNLGMAAICVYNAWVLLLQTGGR